MPETRQVLNWLGLLLLIAIVVPFVIYAVPGAIGAEGSYVVLSGSMEPSISPGDVVIVDGVDPTTVEEQDVITYLRNDADTPTTHRVVETTEQGGELAFVTQGDANDQPDASPVPASQVMGQVIFTIPYIGYVIQFVNTPTGFVALVLVPFVLLLLSEMWSILTSTGSEPNGEESGEMAEDTPGSDPARAVSAPPMGPFETADITATDPDDKQTDPAVRKPLHRPTAVDTNGQRTSPETAEVGDDPDDAIAFTRTDLRLSLGVLTGTTVYAGWVVYNVQEAWSFAVAFGSGMGLLLVGSMYYAAGSDDSTETEVAGDEEPMSAPNPELGMGANTEVRTDGASMPSPESDPGIGSTDQAGSEDKNE